MSTLLIVSTTCAALSLLPSHTGFHATVRQPRVAQPMAAFSPRLVFSEVMLKVQRFLDPELALYALPQRDIIRSNEDIYAVAEYFPEKYRGQFIGWYEGYRKQVLTPKPKGPGLTEADLMVIFNRIIDRILLLTRQPYSFESRHEQLEQPYDYYEFGQVPRAYTLCQASAPFQPLMNSQLSRRTRRSTSSP